MRKEDGTQNVFDYDNSYNFYDGITGTKHCELISISPYFFQ